ncbi:hypothetical protein M422DRAFT_23118 [Sphaerobolus stellatus SS14]|nr:hypothetical protein M422DRAFT_23118 [Sphaerobolus stellatus SS14]
MAAPPTEREDGNNQLNPSNVITIIEEQYNGSLRWTNPDPQTASQAMVKISITETFPVPMRVKIVPPPDPNAPPGSRKRTRRKHDEIERLYACTWPDCTKAYGTLNHLNTHIGTRKHGPKKTKDEFKAIRAYLRAKKNQPKSAQSQFILAPSWVTRTITTQVEGPVLKLNPEYQATGSIQEVPDSQIPSSPPEIDSETSRTLTSADSPPGLDTISSFSVHPTPQIVNDGQIFSGSVPSGTPYDGRGYYYDCPVTLEYGPEDLDYGRYGTQVKDEEPRSTFARTPTSPASDFPPPSPEDYWHHSPHRHQYSGDAYQYSDNGF